MLVCLLGAMPAGHAQEAAPRPGTALSPDGEPASEEVARPAVAGRRIVRHFDFDEEPLGNYDPTPMGWRPYIARGFPEYLTTSLHGAFDHETGHMAPPSFRLELDGGSIGYHYGPRVGERGLDIAVRPDSDYLVVAYVRTRGVVHSRAYMTAWFLDRTGVMIPGTRRVSRMVGGTGGETGWEPLTVALEAKVPEARYIGMAVWLTQADVWYDGHRPPHYIDRRDVHATAWFDDITVYRLPRVSLKAAQPGHVFGPDDRVELQTEVSDPDGLNLAARLVVHAADGSLIDDRPVPVQRGDADAVASIFYDDLPVGLYEAELTVTTGDTVLMSRSLRFVRVGEPVGAPSERGRRFGLILEDTRSALLAGQQQLLAHLRPAYVKVPVWSLEKVTRGITEPDPAVDAYVEAVAAGGAEPIGVLLDDAPEAAQASAEVGSRRHVRSLIELLSGDPRGWKPLLAGTWVRYAGLVHVWQLGRGTFDDGSDFRRADPRLPDVVAALYEAMSPLMSEPALATVTSAFIGEAPGYGTDRLTVMLPATVPPDMVESQLRPFVGEDPGRVWVVVEPPDEAAYPRELRLVDLARRIAEAAFQDVGGVFIPALWETREDLVRGSVHPREDYIIARTLADILGGATPVARMALDGQAQCLVFDHNGRAVLFAWDDYAPLEGRWHDLYLGESVQVIDLWGNREDVGTVGARRRIRIGPRPVLIVDTPTWLVEFRRQFALEDPRIEATFEPAAHVVTFRNTHPRPVTGVVHLVAPDGWDIRPNRLAFTLDAGEVFRQTVAIQFPIDAEAGITAVLGDFAIDADRRQRVLAPAWIELGLADVEMDTLVYRSGDELVVRQVMTNRSDGPIHFEGSLIMPERPRIRRTFTTFNPGQMIMRDFIIEDMAELSGRQIRISLREIQGDRFWNRVVTVP